MKWPLLLPTFLLAIAAAPFDPFGAADIDEHPGAMIPIDTVFRASDGHPASLRQMAHGRAILLVPVLHDCPNFCGVTLDGLARALEARPANAAVIAFGIDPRESTRAAQGDLARVAQRHRIPVMATTGDAASIRKVTDAMGYRYAYDPRIGQYAHAAAIAVLTPDGRMASWLYSISPTPDAVQGAVDRAAAGKTGGLVARLILLCYHYDPAAGSPSLAIGRILTAACVATALLLAAFVLRERRREKSA